ncbi:MAG: SDR family NAD(P)-dependent oxidoreductase [Proteobacteria bacterium]|nr:SDR family NAD(P)-dependent oxidoreductase [Pseudomonadota bacterium]
MPIDLTGRVAVVTGAGNGLGRAHAIALARHGARVVVLDLQPGQADSAVEEIRRAGGEALACIASVMDYPAIEAIAARVLRDWGRVDILVNNAGILRDKTFAKMSVEDFRLVVEVHLMGAVHCTKSVWGAMRTQKFGRIIMTSSSSGLWGNFGQSNYGAAKMALVGLMQTLGLEGEKHGIHVNALAPTAATQMTRGILTEQQLRELAPERVSPAIVFLASDQAPNRAIVCAGAGSFSRANVTMTAGAFLGDDEDAAERLAEQFTAISTRDGDFVLHSGLEQSTHEITRRRGSGCR